MTHHHTFEPSWLCEHLDDEPQHIGPCSRGIWLYLCRCGDEGYGV